MLGAVPQPTPKTLDAFARRILHAGDLATKLAPPPTAGLADVDPGSEAPPERPAREAGLELGAGAERLPRPEALADPEARAQCLARFAHHELMAVELFAWALLRWPTLPRALRASWLHVLVQEQTHCGLYLERLAAHGRSLADYAPHSGYFWRQLPAIDASPAGPRAFLAAMGLTLEQANLDFTLTYRDGFRRAGDVASAEVCQRVHDDEIGHVRSAAQWLTRLDTAACGEERELAAAYDSAVPFPLSAARAKGRRFDAAARRRAGLDDAFIEGVRRARSRQQERPEAGPAR